MKKDKKKLPFVSVVIPTYNRGKSLVNTLKSLFKQDYPHYEIIVVDQSTKKFPEKEKFLKKNRDKILYIFSRPPNAALARNLGVKRAKGEIILFLDDDVICKKDLIEKHVENYKDKRIGAVAGRVITQGHPVEVESQDTGRITWWGRFTDGFSSQIRQEVQGVISCNASWRKKVIGEIGGFDENFTGPIREDSDLSLRTIKAGYKIIFEPKAGVVHIRADTGGFRKSEGRLNWYYGLFKSETYFFLKHRPKLLLPLILATRWQYFIRCMFGLGREVSWRSIKTPWLGIYHGWQTYKHLRGGRLRSRFRPKP